MNIIIHGTKDGHKIISPKSLSGLLDVTADGAKAIALGQQAYGIRFTADNTIFSQYKIVRDVRGAKRTGFVGFSLFVPKNKKLSGEDILAVLGKVSEIFSQYIDNNNLNEVTEKWTFLDSISNEYNIKLRSVSVDDAENMQSGGKDDAFVYYSSDLELQKYFDDPYQNEYTPYRQVLFVNSNLQGKAEDPLNALRHSENDLTGKIDLDNPKYKLLFNQYTKDSIRIDVKVNGNYRSNKNIIGRKNDMEISWSKPYYQKVEKSGKWYEISSDFLFVNNNEQTVSVIEINLKPETKTITFHVFTQKDNIKVTDAEIKVDTQPWQSLSDITFTAEELGREHKIAARKGDNLFSDVVKITPKDYSAASIPLPLIEKRVVKITAKDQENSADIYQFKVHITGKDFYKVTDQIEFFGDEIYEVWNIQIEKRKEYSDSEIKKFCPARDGNEINFNLKKSKNQPTDLNSTGRSGLDSQDKKRFPNSGFDKKTPKMWVSIGFIVLGLAIGIWALYSFFGKEITLNKWEIEMYVEGDSLMLDKLNIYKENWEKQEQDFIIKSGGGIFGGAENFDSTKWKSDWKPAYESISRAIIKRELINNKNFAELRNQRYSMEYLSLITAIKKIDSTKYEEVGSQLGEVSALTLTQIAEKINKILKPKEPAKEETPREPKREENKQKPKKATSNKNEQPKEQPKPLEQKTTTPPAQKETVTSAQTYEIIQYIKGGKFKKDTLNQYLKNAGENKTLKASINLCLKLWRLNGSKNNSYFSYQEELKIDINLKDSELKDFIDKMCESKKPKYVSELPASDQRKSLSQIKSKLL